MRYVGSNNLFTYLKCRHCKKIYAYKTARLPNQEKKCHICGAPYRIIFFRPIRVKSIIPCLPPIMMLLFFIIIMNILSFPPFLRRLSFNRMVTTSNSLITSIFIPIIGSAISLLPSLFSKSHRGISISIVLLECIASIFIINNTIESHFNSLQIENPDTHELQQYFGSVAGEYAVGAGRLFDNHGNLVYYGHFSNNLYDGYGEKYERIDTVHMNASMPSYRCVYKGDFVEGVYSGQGQEYRYDAEYTFEKENGVFPYLYYEGEFLKGKRCGHGILYGITTKYQGGFYDDKYNGYGNKWFIDSDNSKIYRMEGCYNNGSLNGRGTKYYPNGQILFTGEYEKGFGVSGTFYFDNGNIQYTGEFINSKDYNGEGILYWENGNIRYDGHWSEGSRHGDGVSYREDGTKQYDGEWVKNKHSGYGIAYYSDGISIQYDGYWSENQWNGSGSSYWENGTLSYKGNFSMDSRSGQGTSYHRNGNIAYKGEWANGQFSGEGEWYWATGNLYFKGDFENGNITGYGSTYNEDGTLHYTGNLSDGKQNGEGTSYWPNGNVQYSGEWLNGERSGKGREYNENGELLHEGTFFQDKFIS